MGKIKTIEVSITALRITSEDAYLNRHIEDDGDSVMNSPQFSYLCGNPMPIMAWCIFRKIGVTYMTEPLMLTLRSLAKEGQLEPIKIYKDMRINTGHKRAACMLFLGHEKIKAIIVPDDYKL